MIIFGVITCANKIIYNVQLDKCYTLIKENNPEELKNVINIYQKKYNDFEKEALNKVYIVINENIENIKQGNDNNLLDFLEKLKQSLNNKHIENNYKNINNYMESIKYINENDYINAYIELNKAK